MWETVIGLEVHVQLATQSKLFSGAATTSGAEPNRHVCPVTLGLPGALPVVNREAIRLAVRAALALECTVHEVSVFARKHYFYPDLPKGYQISQFERPLATGGRLAVTVPDRGEVTVGITRLHVEEDAGKSLHDRLPGRTGVDYNRAGVPLVEIVSEPDLREPAEARAYLVALKQLLEYIEVSDCNMEEGHLRVDANLSVRPTGATALGTKQEIKNLNSFAAVERALGSLREMQIAQRERGGTVALHTFSFGTGELRMMRAKEESDDYRYFPDPDLPPLVLTPAWLDTERNALPELPAARRRRFERDFGLSPYEAEVLASTWEVADYFEAVVDAGGESKATANWVMGPVLQDMKDQHGVFRVAAPDVAALLALIGEGTVSRLGAKRVYTELANHGGRPREVAQRLGLIQVGDEDQIAAWVGMVIEDSPAEVERLRAGDQKVLGFLIGQVMKASQGRADPKRVRAALQRRIQ